ncbi:hypothetical protein VSH64_29995 [Amycolatopsis rhabdoformis]|uniref:Nucleotide exchange factor GrpE n=1 Tax=Amycolatopsis rhabdoformis TaxID=1448059 RepID=A0ABZ1HZW2_9PSEU|nr:hypothetical protein [Amycolatopsis rhabdoformis]WSE27086.1 hypothetical protein VSH64_29995 [Amycolatopsis rhabdoformis]
MTTSEDRRQRRHHPEFRIGEPLWGAEERSRLRSLVDQVSAVLTAVDDAGRDTAGEPAEPALSESDLAAAATAFWRARKKLVGVEDRVAKQAGRYLSASQEALDAAGVRIQDHDGIPFDSGLALEALLFQDEPGLTSERVVETVRPSIYLAGRRIQMGQVIVGCPVAPGTTAEEADAGHH